MSLLVTFVLLDGQIADNASFDCLTNSLKDSRSKIAFSRVTRRFLHMQHIIM